MPFQSDCDADRPTTQSFRREPDVEPSLNETVRPRERLVSASTSRFYDVDRVKAVAILLVVVGHVVDPRSPGWWQTLHFDIYNFHMPLFMYISGYVFYASMKSSQNESLTLYLESRAKRLLIPFLVFGIIIVNIKFFARSFANIRRSDFSYFDGYYYLLFDTAKNPAFDLWYLFVLYVFCVSSYTLMRKSRRNILLLFPIGFLAYSVFAFYEPRGGMTDDLYLDHVCWFYLFFVLGAMFCAWRGLSSIVLSRAWVPALLIFLFFQILINNPSFQFASGWRFLFIGVASIFFVHGALIHVDHRFQTLFILLSKNTLSIYLFNSIVIAAVQQTLFRKNILLGNLYIVQAIILVLCGTVIPIALREIVSRVDTLRFARPFFM